jgi:uncharacterized SAM-binding protein YcdF (DUF218 family)
MPTDSLLLSIAICGVFLIFAAVLAWIDHRTTRWQHSRASAKLEAPAAEPPRKMAA